MSHSFLVHFSVQCFLDNPVYLQIRITPYGRSEMTVIFCRQAEVAKILRHVFRLLHAPQSCPAYYPFLRFALNAFQQIGNGSRMYLFLETAFQTVPKAVYKTGKLLYFFAVGSLVVPVDKGDVSPEEIFGYGLVAYKHKFLYDAHGRVPVTAPGRAAAAEQSGVSDSTKWDLPPAEGSMGLCELIEKAD